MKNELQHTSDGPSKLQYQTIKKITNDFAEDRKLGEGGFGIVYKGVHDNGEEIAVKVLRYTSGFDDNVFQKEFQNLLGLKHKNIVELVGFCNESEEVLVKFEGKEVMATEKHMALCFEYVCNGSLHDHISDEFSGHDWHTRYNIIRGTCDGLKYLREGLKSPVLHMDLKPDNILLDNDMVPKIVDFGLSRLFGEEKTKMTISTSGTCGYMPPEYIEFQLISEKHDIFSLGVIIAKIMTGREGFSSIVDMEPNKFVKLVHENWRKRLSETLEPRLLQVYCHQVKRCIEISLQCMERNRKDRPTIQYIVSNLIMTETTIGDLWLKLQQSRDGASIPLTTAVRGRPSAGLYASKPNLINTLPKKLPFSFLVQITNNFSKERILGRGAFGTVYKGILQDGEVIAVKRIGDAWDPRGSECTIEVQNVMALGHENIVKLVGFCNQTRNTVMDHNGDLVFAACTVNFLCYEYMPNGSLANYIYGESRGLDWNICFKIIMGICQGLHFLHRELQIPLLHLDLKPENILLDDNMVPKISDFGLSRLLGHEQTQMNTQAVMGSVGYMAPEYLYRGEVSTQSDIYSLGLLIIEIATGENNRPNIQDRSAQRFIANVRQKWTDECIELMYPSLDARCCEQVKICIETGLKCVKIERKKRPSIEEIINELYGASFRPLNKLSVQPWRLRFPSEPKKTISCFLNLSNNGDGRVAFRFAAKSPKRYSTTLPLCGVVPPRCTYTLTVIMRKNRPEPPSDSSESFTLQSVAVDDDDLEDADQGSAVVVDENFFKNAGNMAGDEVVLKAVLCDRPAKGTASEPTRSTVEIITTKNAQQVLSIDVHPKEPWIMTTHQGGSLRVWNYQTMATLNSLDEVTDEPVHAAKFISREKWIVAGDAIGGIHVYSYDEDEEVTSFDAHDSCITSLAVHPTHPLMLSSSQDDHLIKLWDWEKGWKCTGTFQGHASRVTQVKFNPDDGDSFASASCDGTVKIWSICSDDRAIFTLHGKVEGLLSVDYFTLANHQRLITGSKEGPAQIWDWDTEWCVQNLERYGELINAIYLHPELPIIMTGSVDGNVRLLNSTTYKLKNIIGLNLGTVYAFGYIKGLRRIVVGCHQGIAMVKIPCLDEHDGSRGKQHENIDRRINLLNLADVTAMDGSKGKQHENIERRINLRNLADVTAMDGSGGKQHENIERRINLLNLADVTAMDGSRGKQHENIERRINLLNLADVTAMAGSRGK